MLPHLAKPVAGEVFYLYLSVSGVVVSLILVKDDDRIHVSVYYVSKVFCQDEIKYLDIEKYLYALIVSARTLWPYFHAPDIIVLTNQTLKQFLQKSNTSRRMVKWAVELSENSNKCFIANNHQRTSPR